MKKGANIINFDTATYHTQLCIVGGGLSGMCAAITAARRGIEVVLMHERPVLGGNASSEIRMWIRGADGKDMRETGLVEELALENIYRNSGMNFSIWDSILYEKVMLEEHITLLLNCSCCGADMEGEKIKSITGWQMTTQTWHTVYAEVFADCSGDSILAPITGAKWRMGREGKEEFGESIAPMESDCATMGLSCLIQVRESEKPVTFIPPVWANKYTKEDFPKRINFSTPTKWMDDNFWWMEVGGTKDTIKDAEVLRDELIKIAYGVWDFIKNSGEVESSCWELEWLGFLPGKRESRRYEGKYVLNQNDIRDQVKFQDIIAYGGWSMDDHHPSGFETKEDPTIWHDAPSPYGIPFRCLCSENIENLMFAGRNISATHTANSSTRVMATCAMLGQALGDAVFIAKKHHLLPTELCFHHPVEIEELQQTLLEDDCYIPWKKKQAGTLMQKVTVRDEHGGEAVLTDGYERRIQGEDHAWEGKLQEEIILELPNAEYVQKIRCIFDSDLNRDTWGKNQQWQYKRFPMRCHVFLKEQPLTIPKTLLKAYDIYVDNGDGKWELLWKEENNHQRMNYIAVERTLKRIKFVPIATWGCEKARVYSLELL